YDYDYGANNAAAASALDGATPKDDVNEFDDYGNGGEEFGDYGLGSDNYDASSYGSDDAYGNYGDVGSGDFAGGNNNADIFGAPDGNYSYPGNNAPVENVAPAETTNLSPPAPV